MDVFGGAGAAVERAAAARVRILELRSQAEIGDDAFHALEEELDRLELTVERG